MKKISILLTILYTTAGIVSAQTNNMVIEQADSVDLTRKWVTFGNIAAMGGAAWTKLTDKSIKGLYYGHAAINTYSEKDNFLFMLSADNNRPLTGCNDQILVTYSTSRIEGFNTELSIEALNKRADEKSLTNADYFTYDGIVSRFRNRHDLTKDKSITAKLSLEMEKSLKYSFFFKPSIVFSRIKKSQTEHSSMLSMDNDWGSSGKDKGVATMADFGGGINDMGKIGRTLSLIGDISFSDIDSKSKEHITNESLSVLATKRALIYNTDHHKNTFTSTLSYKDPLSESLILNAEVSFLWEKVKTDRNAFNVLPRDDIASLCANSSSSHALITEKLYLSNSGSIAESNFGIQIREHQRENKDSRIGINYSRWLISAAPYLSVNIPSRSLQMSVNMWNNYIGTMEACPIPVFNGADRLSIGNIYLKPAETYQWSMYKCFNSKSNDYYFSLAPYFRIMQHGITSATWFGESGLNYSLPVNSQKVGTMLSLMLTQNFYMDNENKWNCNLNADANYMSDISYQASSHLQDINFQSFDYRNFIERIYGSGGKKLYSGENGFMRSRTHRLMINLDLSLKYKVDSWNLVGHLLASTYNSYYSIDKTANHGIHNLGFKLEYEQSLRGGILIKSNFTSLSHNGYGHDLDKWTHDWNIDMIKEMKKIKFTLRLKDILGKSLTPEYAAIADYHTSSLHSIIGRSIMVGVTYYIGR